MGEYNYDTVFLKLENALHYFNRSFFYHMEVKVFCFFENSSQIMKYRQKTFFGTNLLLPLLLPQLCHPNNRGG